MRATTSSREMTESGVIDKTALVFGQMDEPPGHPSARRAGRADDGGVLPRRAEAGRAAVHRQHLPLHPGRLRGLDPARPDALGGGLPADAGRRDGRAPGAHHLDPWSLDHLDAGDLRARRRHHRPGAAHHVRPPRRDDGALAADLRAGHLPGRGPARLDVAHPGPALHRATTTTGSPRGSRRSCSATRTCRTSSRSSASTSSPRRTRSSSTGPAASSASCRRTPSWPRRSPASTGRSCRSTRRSTRSRSSPRASTTTSPSRRSSCAVASRTWRSQGQGAGEEWLTIRLDLLDGRARRRRPHGVDRRGHHGPRPDHRRRRRHPAAPRAAARHARQRRGADPPGVRRPGRRGGARRLPLGGRQPGRRSSPRRPTWPRTSTSPRPSATLERGSAAPTTTTPSHQQRRAEARIRAHGMAH